MEKEETEQDMKQGGLCKICERSGKTSHLKVYQINFDEAITFCEDETCTYPLGLEDSSDLIVSRNFTEISNSPQRRHSISSQKPFTGLRKISVPLRTKQAVSTDFKSTGKVLAPYVVGKTASSTESSASKVHKSCESFHSDTENQRADSEIGWYSVNNVSPSQLRSLLLPQWQNKDALCWLDVVMCLFVHSKHLQRLAAEQSKTVSKEEESVLLALVKAYNQACALVNSCRKEPYAGKLTDKKTCNGSASYASYTKKTDEDEGKKFVSDFNNLSVNDKNVKTGAGLSVSADFNDNLSVYMREDYQKAFTILSDCRESLFQYLQPNLKCSKGRNDSPVFAIPLLARGSPAVEKMMKMKYIFHFHCKSCGYRKADDYENILPTFPNTDVPDFTMKAPAFSRPCFRCNSPNQQRVLAYESISDVVMIHFVQGLQSSNLSELEFEHGGSRYTVTGLIQYRNDPDHFVTWIRDTSGKLWLEYDDLKSPVSQFRPQPLGVPPSQIHIVMWEASPLPNPEDTESSVQKHNDLSTTAVRQGNSVSHVNLTKDIHTCMDSSFASAIVSDAQEKERNNGEILGYSKSEPMNTEDREAGDRSRLQNGDTGAHENAAKKSLNAGKSVPFINKGIMMVAFASNGSLVHVPLVSAGTLTANSPVLANFNGNLDFRNSFSPGLHIQALTTDVQGKPASRARADGPRHLTPLTAKSQISLLKSLKSRKNSLVQDVEARSGWPAASVVKRQPLVRRNSGASKSLEENEKRYSPMKGRTIIGRRNSYYSNLPFQGKKFASYKEYSEESWNKYQRDLERQSSCSPVSEFSDFSAPCSPAVSCHSDSVLFQKRKSETSILCEDSDSVPYSGKRRRSKEQAEAPKEPADYPDDDFLTEILSQGATLPPSSITSKSDGECDILRNLYSALNMPMPESASLSATTNDRQEMDMESLPDVKGLATFIESESMNTLDDFLAQL